MNRSDLILTAIALGLTVGLMTSVTSCVKNDTNKRAERCLTVVEGGGSSDFLINSVCGRRI
jgi:hypothetical protein